MIITGVLASQLALESSIGILQSSVALCTASLLKIQTYEGYAVALTAGHCIDDLKPKEIILHSKKEIILYLGEKKIKVKKILFASISPYDFALIELNIKYNKIKNSFNLYPLGNIETPKYILGYPHKESNFKLLIRSCSVNKKNITSKIPLLNKTHVLHHAFLLHCLAYPGMSGGPLINHQNEIVGVISSQAEDGLLVTGIPPMNFFYWLLGLKNNYIKKSQELLCRS